MEPHQIGLGTARGVSRSCRVQDGEEASTKEGRQWSLGLSEDGGRTGRMRHAHNCRVHPGPPSDDRDVRGDETDLYGLRWRRTAERVDAASVVVGATDVLGRNRCNWIRCE